MLNVRNSFCQSPKKLENKFFFKKKVIFPLNIPNVQKIPKFSHNEMFRSKKILSSKKFFRKCRVQFWQPCRKKSPNLQKCLAVIQKICWKKLFPSKKNIFSSRKFSGNVDFYFDNPAEKDFSKSSIVLLRVPKQSYKELLFPKMYVFPPENLFEI